MRTWHNDFPVLIVPYIVTGLVFANTLGFSRTLRESFLDICVTPLLTLEQATRLQLWWMNTSMAEEVAVGLLISLNVALPLMLLLYGYIALKHKAVRFTKVGQLKEITDQFQGQ